MKKLLEIASIFLFLVMVCPSFCMASFEYNSHGKRDPMIPVVDKDGNVLFQQDSNKGKKELALKLQGIIYREDGRSKAIIGGKIYKVGDKISGFTIKSIYKEKVVLTDGKEDYQLFMTKK